MTEQNEHDLDDYILEEEDVTLMTWGISNKCLHKEEETELPEDDEVDVTWRFMDCVKIGKARNFRKTDKGVVADLKIKDKRVKKLEEHNREITAAIKLEGVAEDTDHEEADHELHHSTVTGASIVNNHAEDDLNGNVNPVLCESCREDEEEDEEDGETK